MRVAKAIFVPLLVLTLAILAYDGCHPHREYAGLVRAIGNDDLAGVRACLDRGANPNTYYLADGEGWDESPMCSAAFTRNQAIMLLLIAHGGRVNLPNGADGENQTPLEVAAWNDDLGMVQLLIAHGATVNDDGWGGSWSLENAANVQVAAYLLHHGANPNTVANGSPAVTLLSRAQTDGKSAMAALLKSAGGKATVVPNPPWRNCGCTKPSK